MEILFNSTTNSYLIAGLFLLNFITLIWLARVTSHYNRLIKTANKKNLKSALEGIQKTLSLHEKKATTHTKKIADIQQTAKLHIQDVKLRRFNPFSDTGGDQSFILSILDANQDGVIITSLHSRENTRFYVKSVIGGEGENHQLSKEERKIISSKKRK